MSIRMREPLCELEHGKHGLVNKAWYTNETDHKVKGDLTIARAIFGQDTNSNGTGNQYEDCLDGVYGILDHLIETRATHGGIVLQMMDRIKKKDCRKRASTKTMEGFW